MDLAGQVREAGSVPARVSAAARALGLVLGWGALVGAAVLGGLAWSWQARNSAILFLPMVACYGGFAFWLWMPTGYRADEGALYILRPRGPLAIGRARIRGSLASAELLKEFASRLEAGWLAAVPLLEDGPAGARLVWIDPDLDGVPPGGPRASPWAFPLLGAILIWGGWAGSFWSPRERFHRRYSRCQRPRLGLWVAPG